MVRILSIWISPRRDGYKSKKFEKNVRRQTFPRNSRGTEFAKEPLAALSVVSSLKELLWHIIQIASLNLFNDFGLDLFLVKILLSPNRSFVGRLELGISTREILIRSAAYA